MTRIIFVDSEYEEIESVAINATLFETFQMIDKISSFQIGEEQLRYEKDEISSINFSKNEIEVKVMLN